MPKGNSQTFSKYILSSVLMQLCDNEFQAIKIFKTLSSQFMHLNKDDWLMVNIQETLPKAESVVLHILCVSADKSDTNSGSGKHELFESVLPTYQRVYIEQ